MRIIGHLAGAAAYLAAASAGAAEPTPDKWQFSIAPYVWATALNGDLAVRGRRADIDASFIDILQDTDSIIGLEGRVEVRKGSWGGYVDGIYNRLGASQDFARAASIDVVNKLGIVEAPVFYRIGKWPLEISPDEPRTGTPSLALEPYAGARYTYLGIDLDIN